VPKLATLIVEDDPQLNTIFTLTLQANFELTSLADGQQAYDYLQSNTPEMVILDLNLPGLPGERILEYIRAEDRLAGMIVILATADAAKADELSEQADMVLLKPISPIQLRDLALRIGRSAGQN
jgi:two-component system phosphate regulon response regulator PhoB